MKSNILIAGEGGTTIHLWIKCLPTPALLENAIYMYVHAPVCIVKLKG